MNTVPAKLLIIILLLNTLDLHAQQPVLKVASQDSAKVSLTELKTEVKVIGNYTVTTMEMKFCSTADRVLEGELVFPMPEGVSVSRYAIDINGKMREAVPVEKEKGQVAFENTERIVRIDPGLLEKVEGNNFRTRIYPIPPGGCRKVIIGYEQLLSVKDNYSFVYSLPLHFKQALQKFDFSITVATNYIPEVGSDCNTHLKFEELNKVFTSSASETNYTPDGAFTIIIPKTPDAAEASMQAVNGQYYFLINAFPVTKKVEKKIPDAITVIWDASLSGLKRDHQKELDLLDAYFKAKGHLTVHLYLAGLDCRKVSDYSISGGNWSDMKKRLEGMVYDGATDFSSIKYPAGEEYLVFTDGLNTFGNIDNMVLPQKPVYTVCASTTADYSLLRYVAAKTGGTFINLNELATADAQKYLTEQTLQFLGIKPNSNISDVYPSLRTPVGNNCTIAGLSRSANTTVTLQFGYGATVAFEQPVDMNIEFQKNNFINIEKIWAQKKLAELDIQYEKNKDDIEAIGKKYSIITRNTSLIVLERIEDYVRYEIEPPAELMSAYTSLMNERRAVVATKEKNSLKEAQKYLTELDGWWQKEFKPEAVIIKKQKKISQGRGSNHRYVRVPSPPPVTSVDENVAASAPVRSNDGIAERSNGRVFADSLPISSVRASLRPGETVQTEALRDRNPLHYENTRSTGGFDYDGSPQGNVDLTSGYQGRNRDMNPDIRYSVRRNLQNTNTLDPYGIQIKEWAPETPYLKELNAVAKEARYKKYLELRKENSLPTFYFNVANMFIKDGDTATGYKILSNIAELNLDDHELYKMLGYRLKNIGRFEDEVMVFKKVMQLRPQDPQSYRDYALALADAGKYQQALDMLYLALVKDYDTQIKDLYPGIEEIIVTEINELITRHGTGLNTSTINSELVKKMPVDIRVVLNWNMNATDIDLWVFDPGGEKCFYSNRFTAIGGRISKDFTRGYGPEQFMLKKATRGKYKVMINYYGDRQQKIAGPTTVMAEIYTNYGKPTEQRKMITLQMQKINNSEVLVGEFNF